MIITLEKKILNSLFDALECSGLDYCALRAYESLPDTLNGSDLDLAVLPGQEESVFLLVNEVLECYGGHLLLDYSCSVRVLRYMGCHDNEWWGIAIDLFASLQYKGVKYIVTSDVIARSVDYNGVRVADYHDANTIALTKELLTNGKSRKDYLPKAQELYLTRGTESYAILRTSFSAETLSYLEHVLSVKDDKAGDLMKLVKMLRHDVLSKHRLSNLLPRMSNIMARSRRLFKAPGLCIAFLGTDGAGKTTLIHAASPVLEKAFHSSVQYEHLRPNLLPPLSKLKGKKAGDDGAVVDDPHAEKPGGFVGSLLRLAYYSVDYLFGYWVKIYPRLVKRPHICIFDRYYHDFLIDPLRMRINLPKALIKAALILAPQPRFIFCLGGEPEIIYSRKPETSLSEVTRQTASLTRLCAGNPRTHWIDTSASIERAKHQMMNTILATFEKKHGS